MLAFDGRIHHLEQGFWLKFEFNQVEATKRRPHGLRYSLTLHGADGTRLLGFDNAHGVMPRSGRFRKAEDAHDHWHQTMNDPGRPYALTPADQLLADFFAEVRRVLRALGVDETVIADEQGKKR